MLVRLNCADFCHFTSGITTPHVINTASCVSTDTYTHTFTYHNAFRPAGPAGSHQNVAYSLHTFAARRRRVYLNKTIYYTYASHSYTDERVRIPGRVLSARQSRARVSGVRVTISNMQKQIVDTTLFMCSAGLYAMHFVNIPVLGGHERINRPIALQGRYVCE